MRRSLTVLLPVYNVQATLAAMVLEILEVVSDLTERFELVIVDDGSADATSEVAYELTQHYPQVRAVRHGKCLGREEAIRTGLKRSSGEIILVRDEATTAAVDGIRKLWHAATRQPSAPKQRRWSTARRRTRAVSPHVLPQTGYQMIDRRTMEQAHSPSHPERPNYLARLKDFALGE